MRFFHRQVGDQRTVDSRVCDRRAELRIPHPHDGIEIGKDDEASLRTPANVPGQREHLLQRGPVAQSPFAGALDYRPIGHRIAEGNTEFDDVRARINGRQRDVTRSSEVGVAAGEIGDKRRSILEE